MQHRKVLKEFFRENGQDYAAIHQHAESLTSILPLVFAKKYEIKTRIIHSHSTFLGSSNKLHYLFHKINKLRVGYYANHFFACSDLAANWFYGHNHNVKIINNGIDTSRFKYDISIRTKIRNIYSIQDKIIIGHIGSFIRVKNQKYVVDVFNSFLEINPNSVLWLIGDGPMHEEIKNYAISLNIIDKIIFWGIRRDTNELLQGMDIFLFPSLYEGLPVALIEAQTAGLKIIASKNISQLAALTDNITFLDIDSDAELWAKMISNILPYKRKDCSQEIINKRFDIKTTVQYLEKIYTQ